MRSRYPPCYLLTSLLLLASTCSYAYISDSTSAGDAIVVSIDGLDGVEKGSISFVKVRKLLGSDLLLGVRDSNIGNIQLNRYYWVIDFHIDGTPEYHPYTVTRIVDYETGKLIIPPD